MSQDQSIPYGYCHCGCGEKTKLAATTQKKIGHVRGQPQRFVYGHQRRSSPRPYEVEDRGHDTPCWIWQWTTNEQGYGKISGKGTTTRAHRVYYEKKFGPIPEGMFLDHLCRNRACVNPEHLEPVTPAENARRGSRTILNPSKVREIRSRGDESKHDLAAEFGVTHWAIDSVLRYRNWKDV